MTATLTHAQPVLSAASAAGFRESGLQSLRCLEGDESPNPIVAVRSSGLSFESVIGYCEYDNAADKPVIRSLVSEEYLEMLIAMANDRFKTNADRRERFRKGLMDSCSSNNNPFLSNRKAKTKPADWEDPVARRDRKRAEGLMRKKQLESRGTAQPVEQGS